MEQKKQLCHWKKKLQGFVKVELPSDISSSRELLSCGDFIPFYLDKKTTSSFRKLSVENNCSFFVILLSLFYFLIGKHTSHGDTIVGAPFANRNDERFKNTIGFFSNILPLRACYSFDETFVDLINRVKIITFESFKNQEVQYADICEHLKIHSDLSKNPLIQAMFVMQNSTNNKLSFAGTTTKYYHYGNDEVALANVVLEVRNINKNIECGFYYNSNYFSREKIIEHINDFKYLACCLPNNLNKPLSNYLEQKSSDTIVSVFEEVVKEYPDKVAISASNNNIAYSELNQRVNALSSMLIVKTADKGEHVVIVLESSISFIVSVLACLKAGLTYIPINPELPSKYIEFIINDSSPSIILVNNKSIKQIQFHLQKTINIDDVDNGYNVINNFGRNIRPDNTAYIVYTSGTTNEPKGVLVSHASIVELHKATKYIYNISQNDTGLLFHSMSFDFSIWEIFSSLLNGARLVIMGPNIVRLPQKTWKFIIENKVTILNQTPSSMVQLIAYISSLSKTELKKNKLRLIILGGEALYPKKFTKCFDLLGASKVEIYNMYGITEGSIHCTFKKITVKTSSANISNIGKPLYCSRIRILDKNKHNCSTGEIGQIYISGFCLSQGYLNRDRLNEEKYLDLKFPGDPNIKWFSTGDMGKILADGDLEYIGRDDSQVKIRGFRIELSAIVNALIQFDEVSDAYILVKDFGDYDNRLIAYILGQKKDINLNHIRAHLSTIFPSYMIPSFFVIIERWPLTINGKIDTTSLPLPTKTIDANESSTPVFLKNITLLDSIRNIWSEVIGFAKREDRR